MGSLKIRLVEKISFMIMGSSVFMVSMNSFRVKELIVDKLFPIFKKDGINSLNFENKGMPEPKMSQMEKFNKNRVVDVAIVNNKAYWVHDNILYEAEIHQSGEILSDEAKPVDVINMPEKQLKKIIEVVDSLNR